MSSTSTKTSTKREGNKVTTIIEKTVTYPDGRKETTREEKTETVSDGGPRDRFGDDDGFGAPSKNRDEMMKRFNDMKMSDGDRGFGRQAVGSKTSGGGAAPSSGTQDVSLKDFRKQALIAHNERRKKHKSPALKLSDDLNDYAQNWADHLVKTNQFQHSDCTLKGERLGENIANKWSSNGADYTGEEAVQQWYSEISKHDFTSGNLRGTGHFTQVVWKGSLELGMGKAKGSDGKVIVVGSYRPAGNMMGEVTKNVFPPS